MEKVTQDITKLTSLTQEVKKFSNMLELMLSTIFGDISIDEPLKFVRMLFFSVTVWICSHVRESVGECGSVYTKSHNRTRTRTGGMSTGMSVGVSGMLCFSFRGRVLNHQNLDEAKQREPLRKLKNHKLPLHLKIKNSSMWFVYVRVC